MGLSMLFIIGGVGKFGRGSVFFGYSLYSGSGVFLASHTQF